MAKGVCGLILLCFAASTQGFSIIGFNSSSDNDVEASAPIVGGFRVQIHNFPHQLYMTTGEGFCGAAIIGPQWALTAAHCCGFNTNQGAFRRFSPSQVTLRTGSTNRHIGGVVHNVEQIHPHGLYSAVSFDNDICLLKVSRPFRYTSRTRAIELPSSDDSEVLYRPGTNTYVSGWGDTMFQGTSPDLLMAVQIPLISNEQCRNVYRQYGLTVGQLNERITRKQICAGREGRASCHGDSGGAMVVRRKLIGVVSSGIGCVETPGLYTRVSAFRTWIRGIAGI